MFVIHINGRGGSGKSTLVDAMNTRLGLTKTANFTTRKPRYEGEEGYYFVDEEEFFARVRSGEIIENYFRQSNQSLYGTHAPTESAIYQTEIVGLVALKKWCFQNHVPFLGVYLDVDEAVLLERLQRRKDTNESPEDRLREDEYYELFRDVSDVVYDYNDCTVEQAVEDIVALLSKHCGISV